MRKGEIIIMERITKDNLAEFMEYYHEFHDSYIKEIYYDVYKSKIELLIDVCWSGEPKLKEDNTYETNKTQLKLFFNNVKKYNFKDLFSWDYINEAYIKFINMENKEYICFATDNNDPLVYIVCESIEYQVI